MEQAIRHRANGEADHPAVGALVGAMQAWLQLHASRLAGQIKNLPLATIVPQSNARMKSVPQGTRVLWD